MTPIDKVAEAIREASYEYWYEKQTLGCDSRGEEESRYIAEKVVQALALTETFHIPTFRRGDGAACGNHHFLTHEAAESYRRHIPEAVVYSQWVTDLVPVEPAVGPWGEDRRDA